MVIYPSRAKLLLLLLLALAFVVVGLWIAIGSPAREVAFWKVVVASYLGVPFFAACGLYSAYRLVHRRPALVIDSTGITDSATAFGAGRLTWDEIDHVVLYTTSGQPMLGIVPRDLDGLMGRQSRLQRLGARLNLAMGYAPINVPQVGLGVKLAELADLLHSRHGVRVVGTLS